MDLIYTNSSRVDQGVLLDYELDLAFGADENNLECRVQAGSHCCESGSLLYMEGTEYGGIIDGIESDTDSKEVIYTGRTWHGILNSKVIQPDSGSAYLVLTGEANAVIADLLHRLALTDLFEASSENSGLNISNYKMNRYISGYDGIMKMLKTVGGKLKLTFIGGKVVLSAAAVHDYTQDEEFDADQVPFRAKRNYKGVNHLICLGSGQLEERMVVHLYADTNGNISQTQTQFGLDEVCTIFEYSNIETEEELIQEGMEKFESLMAEDEISIDFDDDSDTYDVGDIIGAVDNITGLSAYTTIAKKIVTIKNGKITISLSPDTAKAGSSREIGGGNGGISGGVESFNGREGAVVPMPGDYTADMVGAVPVGAYSRKSFIHNGFFGNPVDQRCGYIVKPGSEYYVWGSGTVAGKTGAYYKVDSVDSNGNAAFTIGGTKYWTSGANMVRGYASEGCTIDRWKMWIDVSTILIEPDGLLFDGTTNPITFCQQAEKYLIDYLAGKTVTLSILYTAVTKLDSYTSIMTEQGGHIENQLFLPTDAGVTDCRSISFTFSNTTVYPTWFYVAAGEKIKVHGIKLELGCKQTLAYLDENGEWVMNDIPNYAEELAKCQRHAVVLSAPDGGFSSFGNFYVIGSNAFAATITPPTPLRGTPRVTLNGNFSLFFVTVGSSGFSTIYVPLNNYLVSPLRYTPNGLIEFDVVTSETLPLGVSGALMAWDTTATITVDANL